MKRNGKPTQSERVVSKLLRDGYITRNECLRVFITRLGAIICDLQSLGWEFEAKYDDKKDYVYKWTKTPIKKITRTLENGQQITTYK